MAAAPVDRCPICGQTWEKHNADLAARFNEYVRDSVKREAERQLRRERRRIADRSEEYGQDAEMDPFLEDDEDEED